MKKGLLFFLVVLSVTYLLVMYILGKNSNKNVLGIVSSPPPLASQLLTPSPTSSPTDSPSPVPTPLPFPTPVQTKTPTPVFTPSPVSSQEINGFIDRFAGQYGVDPNVIRHLAICESGFRPNAVNGDYVGLFQFGPITWKNIRAEIGEDTNINLRYSAEESTQTAAYALSKGKGKIWPNCVP
jgi:hypothetical protein